MAHRCQLNQKCNSRSIHQQSSCCKANSSLTSLLKIISVSCIYISENYRCTREVSIEGTTSLKMILDMDFERGVKEYVAAAEMGCSEHVLEIWLLLEERNVATYMENGNEHKWRNKYTLTYGLINKMKGMVNNGFEQSVWNKMDVLAKTGNRQVV